MQSKKDLFMEEISKKGLGHFIWARIRKRLLDPVSYFIATQTLAKKDVTIDGCMFSYLCDWYNFTWTNERAIEIPYFRSLLTKTPSTRILEIGNVLSHYGDVTHTVVDKYEIAPGVINEDVTSYTPQKKFDLIIAISTLEHVGWHEELYEKDKVKVAIKHLQKLLSPSGKLVFSVPLGLNDDLDRLLSQNKLPFDHSIFLKRISFQNEWKQVPWKEVQGSKYNHPYPNANAILIGTLFSGHGSKKK